MPHEQVPVRWAPVLCEREVKYRARTFERGKVWSELWQSGLLASENPKYGNDPKGRADGRNAAVAAHGKAAS